MAVILAGAMLLFMGLTLQPAFAGDDQGDGQDDAQYNIQYTLQIDVDDAQSGSILPGSVHHLTVTIYPEAGGQPILDVPEGSTFEWGWGAFEESGIPEDFAIIVPDPDNPLEADVMFDDLPEGKSEVYLGLGLKMKDSTGVIIGTSESCQLVVAGDYYESVWPIIDGDMLKGEEAETTASVTHCYISKDGVHKEPCEIDFKWEGFPTASLSKSEVKNEDGSYTLKFKRLATETACEYALTMSTKDGNWSETQWYRLYGFSTDLSKCNVKILEDSAKHFTVYEDNWVFFDEQAVGNPGLAAGDFHVTTGDMMMPVSADCFEVTELEKYVGYTENSDDAFEPTKFPLKFDPKGTKDRNGNRTDGTSLYHFTVNAKAGSGWTGKTDMYVFVNSKYSLYNFQDYFIGTVEFPSLAKYLKDWDKDPYMRYEVPKGSKAKKTLVIKLGNDKLTPGKQITVKYRNDKTKKEYSSFPTNKPGEYTLVITGKSPYYGTDKSTHLKIGMKNPLVVKGKTVKIKKKQIKKKAKTVKVKSVIQIKKKGKGKLTYKKLSGNKKITVASNGKVKVKKGLKKGTYKIKVSVTAAGNDQYFPITKKVTFKIKVKK